MKEKQEHMIQLQVVYQQLKQIQQQLQLLDQQRLELEQTKENVAELVKTPKDQPLFVPVASGIFTKARWEDGQSFFVNVGAGTVVEKSPLDVKRLVEKQLKEAETLREEMLNQVQRLVDHATKLEKEIEG